MERRLAEACARWNLNGPVAVAETPRARIWKAWQGDRPVALKLLSAQGIASEGHAPALLRHWAGFGAVTVRAAKRDALLLDWLPGPSLGDLARGGDDDAAARLLAATAERLQTAPGAEAPQATPLATHLSALFAVPDPPADIARARALARDLLASAPAPALLHGDLHHDNVRADGADDWAVIDPKGVLGDPAYELANAFRNPVGLATAAADPVRARRLTAIFAETAGHAPERLLGWAAVQSAVALCWDGAEHRPQHPEYVILATLLALASARPRA